MPRDDSPRTQRSRELPPISPTGRATYTVADLTTLLGLGRDAIYAAASRNEIPGTLRIGRRLVFSRAKIHAWLGTPSVLPCEGQPPSSD